MQSKFKKIFDKVSACLKDIDTTIYTKRIRQRSGYMPIDVMLSVLIYHSYLACQSFKLFVEEVAPKVLPSGQACISYNRWCYWRKQLSPLLTFISKTKLTIASFTGLALTDSTVLPVCAIQRERDHKSHAGNAAKTMSSLGWAYGYKLHLITNENGLILRWGLTAANVHDITPLKDETYTAGLTGILMGDSAYTSKPTAAVLANKGLNLVVKPKNAVLSKTFLYDNELKFYGKRWKIEVVIGALKEQFGLKLCRKTRHAASFNFCVAASLFLFNLFFKGIS